ncbi:MAG: nucleotidyltransferase family protein [Myxococcales bacterium]|nr:nucleotidyltransferase family protein [Myxococcales bacterium]
MAALLDTLRVLASFQPPKVDLSSAPWDEYVDWAIAHGLGPLAAYNLEYRLGGAGAPQWAKDRLLSVYQGTANDNVMKLVGLKRTLGELAGRRIVVFDGASFAEALYPHVAFRPLPEIRLLVRREDLDGLTGFLASRGFHQSPHPDPAGAAMALADGRTEMCLHAGILGDSLAAEEAELLSRCLPLRAFGPSLFRLDLEDATLALCLHQARVGYQLPTLSFVDLRELLLGAPSLGGDYSRPPDFPLLLHRAKQWGLERALCCSVSIAARLFPEIAEAASRASPQLRPSTRSLLERLVVRPASTLGGTRAIRGGDRLRRLLTARRPRVPSR